MSLGMMSRGPHTLCTHFYYRCCSCSKLLLLLWAALTLPAPISRANPAYRAGYFEGKCTDAETGRELFIGEAFTRPGQCIRVQCLGTLQLWHDRCQVPKLQGNCSPVPPANEFLNYPLCCPLYTCKSYVTNEVGETEETRTYDQYGSLRRTHISQVFNVDPARGKIPGSGVMTQFEI
ncbi:protein Vago [Anastrepha obliqua]|uniref:protein Vago n=1 Tax=Anastrepha obliqua TaxID=95512 RepID=UPI002409F347|nr:protein Vago [Anastrepha obliqua]